MGNSRLQVIGQGLTLLTLYNIQAAYRKGKQWVGKANIDDQFLIKTSDQFQSASAG
jgi:hypothetical protein